MVLKSVLLFSVVLLSYVAVSGQQPFPYEVEWKKADTFILVKNLPESALTIVNRIYTAAKKDRNEPQWVKAVIYRNQLQQPDVLESGNAFQEMEKEIHAAPTAVSAILKSFFAERCFEYLQNHHYQFSKRTNVIQDTSSDISTWTIERLNDSVRSYYLASINDALVLQRIPMGNYNAIVTGGNVRYLRPSLYDFLTWRALNYFQTGNYGLQMSLDESLQQNDQLFYPAQQFVKTPFTGHDILGNFIAAIQIYQQLLKFHEADTQSAAFIDADIKRIQFVYQYSKRSDKDSLYMQALEQLTARYPDSLVSQAWYLQARWWSDKAQGYDPLKDTAHRFDYLRAIALCERGMNGSGRDEGKSNCEMLYAEINKKQFSLDVEAVNLPDLPFRALISYKNVQRLYARIIRFTKSTQQLFDKDYPDPGFWKAVRGLSFEKQIDLSIPKTSDYQQHRVEIKIDGLPPGQYGFLVSSDPSFTDSSILSLNRFFSSAIAFLGNAPDYFVLDRSSGRPLKNVKVKSAQREYRNNSNVFQTGKTYTTDEQGHFRLNVNETEEYNRFEFYYNDDFLSSEGYSNSYSNQSDEDPVQGSVVDNIFTDRSIYRPGQTVYFKLLLAVKGKQIGDYRPVTRRTIRLSLKDINRQTIDSITLVTNDYGSAHGSFRLPTSVLNGSFTIVDAVYDRQQEISVEEYKRPTFYVTYDSLKAGYRIGDSLKLQGTALAYAGNTIGHAKIHWTVNRNTQYLYPWMFRYYPAVTGKQIAFGESMTDETGRFTIPFVASPDEAASKGGGPIYTYTVDATVTDDNGESRSASSSVSVSNQSFQIECAYADKSRLETDALDTIPVTTKNINGVFVPQELSISLYELEAPDRLIRERYWQQPDQFVMTMREYIAAFPHDEYKNETDMVTWKSRQVTETTDSTRFDQQFVLRKPGTPPLQPGWYLLEFRAPDKNGAMVVDKRFIHLIGPSGATGVQEYNKVPYDLVVGEPGKNISLRSGSDALDVYVIRKRDDLRDKIATFDRFTVSREMKTDSLKVTATDRGGFAINDVFVKDNRWYASEHRVLVPWADKELQVTYQTWKNKIQPGSQQQWRIKITGLRKETVAAEMLTGMYDASLDQFKMHNWSQPNLYPIFSGQNSWNRQVLFNRNYSDYIDPPDNKPDFSFRNEYDELSRFPVNGLNDVVVMGYGLSGKKDLTGAVRVMRPNALAKKNFSETDSVVEESVSIENTQPSGAIQVRKDFRETAFFQPDLKTDSSGNVIISFTAPDALTQWKWMVLASTKDLSFGYSEKIITTQKDLMVQTNMPRFFREGDSLLLPVKISNLSGKQFSGTVQLDWMDINGHRMLNQELGNRQNVQVFSVNAGGSQAVFFPLVIPAHFTEPVWYRILASTDSKSSSFSDGEENVIPVLSNRMLVTESMPLNMHGGTKKQFRLEKLLKSDTQGTMQNQALTLEYTSNPAWYAVQSLPYLIEFPYECAEQTFNRYYANALAGHIVQVSPALQNVFEQWKKDTSALLSNLQKNETLKTVLLNETPWVLDAQNESQQKKNLALLFDLMNMKQSLKSAMDKLQQMQSGDGGFPWFKGGGNDRYITQYIVEGIGRLKKLNALPMEQQQLLEKIAQSSIAWLDGQIVADYFRRDQESKNPYLSPDEIMYLYMRSYFPEIKVPGSVLSAFNYYKKLTLDQWMTQPVYMQGMIALSLNRTGDAATAKGILASLIENASRSPELGMSWKTMVSGFYWTQAPVETQSLLIEVFHELKAEAKLTDEMKYWLLQQKHTKHWPTTKATADACYALLLSGSDWITSTQSVTIQLGNRTVNSADQTAEAGSGYFKMNIPAAEITPAMGNVEVSIQPGDNKKITPSWGALYWQYFENLDKISSANTGLALTKDLYIEKNSAKGPVLEKVSAGNMLKPGDKLKMRIIIRTDRDLEYVHLKDMRAACLEPVNVLSGYQWQDGLGYYQTTKDASTSFFFDRLNKGTYVFEYPVFVTTAGNYSNGISTLECMYAPEFAAHSEGIRIQVKP